MDAKSGSLKNGKLNETVKFVSKMYLSREEAFSNRFHISLSKFYFISSVHSKSYSAKYFRSFKLIFLDNKLNSLYFSRFFILALRDDE